MKRFEFNNKTKIDLAGTIVELKTDMATIDRGIEFGRYMQKKANEIIEVGKSIKKLSDEEQLKKLDEYNKSLCNDCYKFIDEVTEQGTSEKIFKDRKDDMYDCVEIITFLIDALNEHRTEKINKQSAKYNPNRAERRSNNNKKKRH